MLVEIEHEYKTEQQVQLFIEDGCRTQIEYEGKLLSLCMATPKDICPPDQDPFIYTQSLLKDLLESYKDEVEATYKLILIRDAWTDNP